MAGRTTGTRTTRSTSRNRKLTKAQEQARRQLGAIVLFAVGLFLGALSLIQGENFWRGMHDTLYGLFGFAGILIAPLLLYIAIMATLDKPIGSLRGKSVQILILLVMVSSTVQVFSYGPLLQEGFWNCTVELFQAGVLLEGGGIAAALLGLPLMKLLGDTGAGILLIILLFVTVMLFTGGTLIGLFRGAAKPVRKLSENYTRVVSQRPEAPLRGAPKPAPEIRPPPPGQARFNVDIPLEQTQAPVTEPVLPMEEYLAVEPMPAHPVQLETRQAQGSFARQTLERMMAQENSRDQLLAAAQPGERFTFDIPLESDHIRTSNLPAEANLEVIETGESLYTPEAGFPESAQNEETIYFHTPTTSRLQHEAEEIDALVERAVVEESEYRQIKREETGFATGGFSLSEETAAEEQLPWTTTVLKDPETPLEKDIEPVLFETGGIGRPEEDAEESDTEQSPLSPGLGKAAHERFAEEIGSPDEYVFPPISLLKEQKRRLQDDNTEELKANAQRLVDTLKSFGVQTRIIDVAQGPAVTRYELQPSAGVKISKITSLADDIALNLAAAGVRIEAPIPNKPAVGIEVPNKHISMVSIREIIDSPEFVDAKTPLTMALGRDISGKVTVADIGKMPHMLIAGATGSGKSVCINSLIISLMFKASPDEVKLLLVDPKVVELGVYNGIPHLLVPVVTDPKKAAGALAWAVGEMLGRYKLFADNAVRDLAGFNRLCKTREELKPMPQIVIIIDELADLMMAAPSDVEDYICRLAQMARAAGMHLVIATQRPSVDVITGVIKANIPSRIAFAVSSSVDSRTILDSGGAEKLLGRGDMLFYPVGTAKPTRVQGCFVTDSEVERVVEFVKRRQEHHEYDEAVMEEIERQAVTEKKKSGSSSDDGGGFAEEDDMIPAAIECVIDMGVASTSMLQRRLKLGYARAARIIDELEQKGIVGPFEGSKPRQVLISKERWQEMQINNSK